MTKTMADIISESNPIGGCVLERFASLVDRAQVTDDNRPKEWIKHGGLDGGQIGAVWKFGDSISIHHCGHQTANYPYYGIAFGERVLAPNGRGFRLLRDAKKHLEAVTA